MSIRILLVDDDESIKEVIAMTLEGYLKDVVITESENGEEGLDELLNQGEQPFDLIITDNTMPKMTGIQMTEEIKKHDNIKHIPIILCTGDANINDIRKSASAIGINIVLPKPFDNIKDVSNAAGELLSGNASTHENEIQQPKQDIHNSLDL